MDFRHLERFQPQLLAILRIIAGLLFLEHGLSKFFGFPVPFPVHPLPTLLLAAGVIELVAGKSDLYVGAALAAVWVRRGKARIRGKYAAGQEKASQSE